MSTARLDALSSGLIAFLVVWVVVLVPQLAVQLHRYGRLVLRQIVIVASVLLYACLSLAAVFLPLPGPGSSADGATLQLHPFRWITDMRHNMTGSGLLNALTTPDFEQMSMNVLLFVPLGIFARLLWKRGLVGSTLLGFGVSFLIEATQLTANWGTAPFQYRVADVDDLIMNTSGAALGWLAGALFLALRQAKVARSAAGSAFGAQAMRREGIDLTETR